MITTHTPARQSRRVDVSSLCGPYSLLDAPSASHLDRIAAGDLLTARRNFTAVTAHLHQPLRRRREATRRRSSRKSPIYTPAAAKSHLYASRKSHLRDQQPWARTSTWKIGCSSSYRKHAGLYGGYKKKKTIGLTGALLFDCCALSLLPFDSPVCARDGILFDALQLLPHVQEKGVSPATGKKLAVKDVLRLKMAKNQDNQWHCPVTCKVLTNHSKVVCIARYW